MFSFWERLHAWLTPTIRRRRDKTILHPPTHHGPSQTQPDHSLLQFVQKNMLKPKNHNSKRLLPALPDRAGVDSPVITPIYDTMAQSNRPSKGVPHYGMPNDPHGHLQRARDPLEENKTAKPPYHHAQTQSDPQTPSPLKRTASDEIPKLRTLVTTTRRKDEAQSEEFADLNDKLRQTQIELYSAVEQLAALHSADPFREGDDKIARRMEELRHDIRQWSQNFYQESKKSSWERFINSLKGTPEEESPFREITSDHAAYLKDERGPMLLVQGLIWQILLCTVFDRFLWLGGPCQSAPGRNCQISEYFQFLVHAGYGTYILARKAVDSMILI